MKNQEPPGDDPEAVRQLVCFTAIHWRVATRRGIRPETLTPGRVARLMAEDAEAFQGKCAATGLPVAPRSQVHDAALRARRYFRQCAANGRPPAAL